MTADHHASAPPDLGDPVASWDHPSLIDRKDRLVDELVAELLRRGWIGEDGETWARLCFEEAVTNAMLHGNQGDPTLRIRLELFDHRERWVLVVRDQGDGFDPADLPATPAENDLEALLREHGRGIPLMREWLDELTWYDAGATVLLARRIDADEHAGPET